LNRDDLAPGHFGENFTVTGLADAEVCIGDRYRIGDAEFENTQPRVTCFRVGLRLNEPEMPNLLVAQHRPGFYFRVITEGHVRPGDDIVQTRRGRHELSVADVDALLYLPDRNIEQLRKIVDVPALSPGWQQSFNEMLAAHERHESSAATTAPPTGVEPGWNGFRPLRVSTVHRESENVLSIGLEAEDRTRLPRALPGQYLTVRIPLAGNAAALRSYSLSGDPGAGSNRISVKREEQGLVSQWLHAHIQPWSVIEAAAPRGDFYLTDDSAAVVLISAGIGATPVLAMLHALSAASSGRDIWWLHTTRNRETQAFATEVTALIESLPHARQRVFYTQTDGRCGLPLRPNVIHGRYARCAHGHRIRSRTHPQRTIRCATAHQSRHRRHGTAHAAAPAPWNTRQWTVDHLFTQRAYSKLVARLRQHSRPGRSMRRANPIRLPKRGMSCLRHRGCGWDNNLRPVTTGAATAGNGADLLGGSENRPCFGPLAKAVVLSGNRTLAAGRAQDRAVDVAGLRRAEERHCNGDFTRFRRPAQRGGRRHRFQHARYDCHPRSVGRPDRDGVNPHSRSAEFICPHPRQLLPPGFGCLQERSSVTPLQAHHAGIYSDTLSATDASAV
jgi:ferredoxin-NADP reductase